MRGTLAVRLALGFALLVLAAGAAPRPAHAHPGDLYGFGSRGGALAGSMVARPGDFTALFYNPGALATLTRGEVSIGVLGYGSNLSINGQPAPPLEDQVGILVGAAAPIPFGGVLEKRLYAGLLLYLLPDRVDRILARKPDQAFFPYYNDRANRLVVIPGLAARLHTLVSLGLGINVFSRLAGAILGNPGATRAIEPRVDEQIITTAGMHGGLRLGPFRAGPGTLALGLAYRQSYNGQYDTVVLAELVGSRLGVNVSAKPFFTPGTLVAGGAYDVAGFSVSLDVGWVRWSAYPNPFVKVTSVLPLIGDVSPDLPKVQFHDTPEIRVGLERVFQVRRHPGPDGDRTGLRTVTARIGYGYLPSPVPAQTGITNLADSDKHLVAAGLGTGLVFGSAGRMGELDIDAHLQAHLLTGRTDAKGAEVPTDNPGYPMLRSGGQVISAGLTLTYRIPSSKKPARSEPAASEAAGSAPPGGGPDGARPAGGGQGVPRELVP